MNYRNGFFSQLTLINHNIRNIKKTERYSHNIIRLAYFKDIGNNNKIEICKPPIIDAYFVI